LRPSTLARSRMYFTARRWRYAVVIGLCAAGEAVAQQAAPQQPGVQQAIDPQTAQQSAAGAVQQQQPPQNPIVPQVPNGFQLNTLQQTALDAVLTSWQANSAAITTFQCKFERWEYDPVFGPQGNIPLYKNKGEVTYNKPDKGSFQITETNKWQ